MMASVKNSEIKLSGDGNPGANKNIRTSRKRRNSGSLKTNDNRSSHNRRRAGVQGLMHELRSCKGVTAVLNIHASHYENMTCQDLANCWNRIVKILRERPSERKFKKEELELLLKDTMNNLERFKPTPLAATAHSMANVSSLSKWNAGQEVWHCLQHRGQLVVGDLSPKSLANMAWAAATAGHCVSSFFDDTAKATMCQLDKFNEKDIAIVAWACARGRYFSTPFFQAIVKTAMPQLGSFDSQSLSNFVCACATASYCPKALFDTIATVSTSQLNSFSPLSLANFAWAFATAGFFSKKLMDGIAVVVVRRLNDFEPKSLANIAWAYAVLDQSCENLFGVQSGFVGACNSKAGRFSVTSLRQLHQWQLWCQERNLGLQLNRNLRQKCRDAFVEESCNSSQMQRRVSATLTALDLKPEQEVMTDIGYSLDAVVTYRGRKVGIEVDGPSHFIKRSPNGATQLKRRQLSKLERECCLLSVPHWEWRALPSADKRKKYLMESLDRAIAGTEALSRYMETKQ